MTLRFITKIVLITGCSTSLFAQNPIGNATIEQRVPIIEQLQTEQQFEEALHEFEDLRFYLKREKIQSTPQVIRIAKSVFISNNMPDALEDFLLENGLIYAEGLSDFQKIELQKEIILAYQAIGKEQIANDMEEGLFLLYEEKLRTQSEDVAEQLRKQGDSLRTLYTIAPPQSSPRVVFQKQKGIFFLMTVGFGLMLGFIIYRKKAKEAKTDVDKFTVFQQDQEVSAVKLDTDELTIKRLEHEQNENFLGRFYYNDEFEMNKVALIIESDTYTARYLRMVLSKRFQIEMAATTSEAHEAIHKLLPDIIICNVQLREADGVSFVRNLKMSQLTMHIPVVLLTHDLETGQLDVERSNADCFIPKPTPGNVFYDNIDEIFKNKKSQHLDIQRIIQLRFNTNPSSSSDAFIESVLDCIEKYMADSNFTPDILARKFNMSKMQFYRKIVAMTGRTPFELIRELRLEKANYMLQSGEMPKPIISQIVGYENEGIFSLAFRNHFGDTTLMT